MGNIRRTVVSLAAALVFLSAGNICLAADSDVTAPLQNKRFDQGKQGDAKGGLERTAGKKVIDVEVPAVPAPEPVSTSTGTAGGYSVGTSSGH